MSKENVVFHPVLASIVRKYEDSLHIAKREQAITKQAESKVTEAQGRLSEVSEFLIGLQHIINSDNRVKVATFADENIISTSLDFCDQDVAEKYRTYLALRKSTPEDRALGVCSSFDVLIARLFCIFSVIGVIAVFVPRVEASIFFQVFIRIFGIVFVLLSQLLTARAVLDLYGDEFRKNKLDEEITRCSKRRAELSKRLHTPAWFVNNFPARNSPLRIMNEQVSIYKDKTIQVQYANGYFGKYSEADAFMAQLVELLEKPQWSWNTKDTSATKWRMSQFAELNSTWQSSSYGEKALGFNTADLVRVCSSMNYISLQVENFYVVFCISELRLHEPKGTWDGVKPMYGYTAEEIAEYMKYAEEAIQVDT